MALYSEQFLKRRSLKKSYTSGMTKTASAILTEATSVPMDTEFDIFLSHRYRDASLIVELKDRFEELGYSVYVDWNDDPELSRYLINKKTANRLRNRMRHCRSLFYVVTERSRFSLWMPWECGYFDGYKNGNVAICPITKSEDAETFKGQEYLSLYPYVDEAEDVDSNKDMLWINETPKKYISMNSWLKGEKPYLGLR